jgi:hypothetical protein
MVEVNETHEKIISVLREKGPSLPIKLSKDIDMSSLFISAFLSELANQKRVKITGLKVGGSPLYYLEGQEEQLEPYHKYLHPKEVEAFLILKERKVLKDADQDPPTRVALRSLKDFSIGFKINEQIYWRYILVSESEAKELLQPKTPTKKTPEKIISQNQSLKKQIKEMPNKAIVTISKQSSESPNEFQNPLVIPTPEQSKKQKPKSEFSKKAIEFIKNNNLEIISEKDHKTKEYNCIIKINSQLGPLKFLTQAKDKKTISETDLKKLLSIAQSIPLPAFILYTGDISKKAKDYLRMYSSILKAKKIS